MKMSTFTEEQIVQILRDAEAGEQTIGRVCRAHGIAKNTFYKWRKKYGGVDVVSSELSPTVSVRPFVWYPCRL